MVYRLDLGDDISISNNRIIITSADNQIFYQTSQIIIISIIISNDGPAEDDMGLAIGLESGDYYVVMSENPLFKELIFEKLPKIVTIDFTQVIAASSSAEAGMFVLYKR